MKRDAITDEALDSILSEWHAWASADGVGRGFPSRAVACGNFRISRQYDYDNGVLDGDIDNTRMRDVDFQVREMQDPHRSAIYANAKALCTGFAVWRHPRIAPEDQERITGEARAILSGRLTAAGIL